MDMDFLNSLPHKIYDFHDGFVVFVIIKNIAFASCGFLKDAKNVFHKCKQAMHDFVGETGVTVHAGVHQDNKPSRMLMNALGFKFMCQASNDPMTRLYKYEG
jgi:hypothetical protein